MKPPVRALLWYFWRLSRWNIALLIVLCTSATFLVALARGDQDGGAYAYINILAQVTLIFAIGGCFFMQGSDRAFVPPQYLMTLPLATGRYLAVFYGYLIAVIGAISCAMMQLHLTVFGNVVQQGLTPVTIEFWQMPLLCICLVCMIQSIFHLSGIRNELLFVPAGIAMIVLGFSCALPLMDPGHHTVRIGAQLAAVCFACACSSISLAAYRYGRWDSVVTPWLQAFERGPGRVRAFATPARALFWLGWRRHGRVFLVGTLLFCLLGLMIGLMATYHYDSAGLHANRGAAESLTWFLSVPIILSGTFFCAVIMFTRDNDDFHKGQGGYFLTLPFCSVMLARGRLLAMAFSLVLVTVVMATVFLLFLRFAQSDPNLGTSEAIRVFPLAAASAWIGMWFGLAAVPVFVAANVTAGILSLVFPSLSHGVAFTTIVLTISLPAIGAILWTAIHDRILDRANVFLLALVSGLALVAYLFLPMWHYARPTSAFATLLLIPLPFVSVPLALDLYRHR